MANKKRTPRYNAPHGWRAGVVGSAAIRRQDLLRVQGPSTSSSPQGRTPLRPLRRCRQEAGLHALHVQEGLALSVPRRRLEDSPAPQSVVRGRQEDMGDGETWRLHAEHFRPPGNRRGAQTKARRNLAGAYAGAVSEAAGAAVSRTRNCPFRRVNRLD